MTTLTLSQTRAQLPAVLDRVATGEEVTISRHGKPVAVVVRPDALPERPAVVVSEITRRAIAMLDAGPLAVTRIEAPPEWTEAMVAHIRKSRRDRA